MVITKTDILPRSDERFIRQEDEAKERLRRTRLGLSAVATNPYGTGKHILEVPTKPVDVFDGSLVPKSSAHAETNQPWME